MSIPAKVRDEVKAYLWAEADRLNWPSLSAADKARYYTIWTETKELGGRLAVHMDPRQVRVYIKDTLLKPYTREALADHAQPFRVLDIPEDAPIQTVFIKPHGRLLKDGRHVAWSRAADWKATILTLYERAHEQGEPYGVVLMESSAKFGTGDVRAMVENAAAKLGIQRLVWLD